MGNTLLHLQFMQQTLRAPPGGRSFPGSRDSALNTQAMSLGGFCPRRKRRHSTGTVNRSGRIRCGVLGIREGIPEKVAFGRALEEVGECAMWKSGQRDGREGEKLECSRTVEDSGVAGAGEEWGTVRDVANELVGPEHTGRWKLSC